jgi:hypothetical protein
MGTGIGSELGLRGKTEHRTTTWKWSDITSCSSGDPVMKSMSRPACVVGLQSSWLAAEFMVSGIDVQTGLYRCVTSCQCEARVRGSNHTR